MFMGVLFGCKIRQDSVNWVVKYCGYQEQTTTLSSAS